MRILVLGGTSFVGRGIVEAALDSGADVTLFGRGQTNPDLFPQADRRVGDRTSGAYEALAGTDVWDAVVDVSGYVPRHVAQAADAVEGRVGRYLFISTASVYDLSDPSAPLDETMPRLKPLRGTEEQTHATYGPLKAACEDDVLDRFGERATLVRPGIVGGPHDPTDRLTWWVRRAARGGRIPVPGDPAKPAQVVDVHDLGALVLKLVSDDRPGAYNAVGPAEPTTMAGLVEACARAAGADVEVVPVPAGPDTPALPFATLPPEYVRLFQLDASRARTAGLPSTPLVETARKVLEWDRGRGEPPLSQGLTAEQEAQLLATA